MISARDMGGKAQDAPIAIFLPSLGGGGAERNMQTLANGFVRRGRPVDLVLVDARGPYIQDLDPRVRLVDLGAKRVLTSIPRLARYLRTVRPAALLSALSHANVAAIIARSIAGYPHRLVISERVSLRAADAHERGGGYRLLRAMMRLTYPRADAITVVARAMIEELQNDLGLAPERIAYAPNPVVTSDLLARAAEPPTHPFVRRGSEPLILGVGRLSAQKDFVSLIKAFELLRRQRPMKLLILGEGEDRPMLEALVRERQLENDVAMPGFASNPFSAMRDAQVFALSSRYEGLPGTLIQAMAVGTAVVSTDCPTGPAEILENGRWGHLVPVGNPEALALALKATLEGEALWDVVRRAADFGDERAINMYLALLDAPAGKTSVNMHEDVINRA